MFRKKGFLVSVIMMLSLAFITACGGNPAPAGPNTGGTPPATGGNTGEEQAATDFPKQNITILVHTSAGGPTDLMAREIAKAAGPILGQNIIVENKPGGSGATQMAALSTAKPDGYTLATLTPSQIGAWNGNLKGQFSLNSFTYVQGVQVDPYIMVVHADSPYQTLQDLLDDMKANPGKITVGGYGAIGSGHNIAFNLLAESAGVDAAWTAYESTGDAVTALLGKHIVAANSNPGQVSQYVKAGQLRVLAVMSEERLASMPDVPTYKEAGYDVDTSWAQFRGLFAPAGVPENVLNVLNDAFAQAMETEEFKTYMENAEMEDGNMNNEQFTQYVEKQDKLSIEWMEKLGVTQ